MTNDKIQIYLNLDPLEIELQNNMRDVTNIGHFGTGNLEIIITSIDEYNKSKALIELAYNQN
jgi:predicted transport protein